MDLVMPHLLFIITLWQRQLWFFKTGEVMGLRLPSICLRFCTSELVLWRGT